MNNLVQDHKRTATNLCCKTNMKPLPVTKVGESEIVSQNHIKFSELWHPSEFNMAEISIPIRKIALIFLNIILHLFQLVLKDLCVNELIANSLATFCLTVSSKF